MTADSEGVAFDEDVDNDLGEGCRLYSLLDAVEKAQEESKRVTESLEPLRRELREGLKREEAAAAEMSKLAVELNAAMREEGVEAIVQNGYVYYVNVDRLIKRRCR